ncbi:MAG: ferredoxin family protein [Nitrospirota bacterium]
MKTRGATLRRKGAIAINRELCKGCAYCVEACPTRSIGIEKRFNAMGYFPAHVLHPEQCTGCAVCAQVCPEIAIEVWQEDIS